MKTHTRSFHRSLPLLAGLALLLGGITTARAQTPTVIDHVPYTINTKGLYVLNQDLGSSQTSGTLIFVNTSNVTIDLQGHFLSGPAGVTNQNTTGIRANERSNVTIRNGTIAFCYEGIVLEGNGTANTNSVGHIIENMRITYCYYLGAFLNKCPSSRITSCQVSQIGSTNREFAYGLAAIGQGAVVQGNAVSTVTSSSTGAAFGIYDNGTDCFFRQNTVFNVKNGVFGGKYQDNLTLGCTTPYSQGIDAGGNN